MKKWEITSTLQNSTNRAAFTLIELMVSIALTVIIVLFLYKTLAAQRIANGILQKKSIHMSNRDKIFDLLYRDLGESNSSRVVSTLNKNYNILYIDTTNSLHAIPFVHVAYYVNAKDKTLIRLESSRPFTLPVKIEQTPFIFADIIAQGVEKFRIFHQGVVQQKNQPSLPGEAPKKQTKQSPVHMHWLCFIKINGTKLLFEI